MIDFLARHTQRLVAPSLFQNLATLLSGGVLSHDSIQHSREESLQRVMDQIPITCGYASPSSQVAPRFRTT